MATLSLKNRSTSVYTVPVEEWYEELADEAANPEYILIQQEEDENDLFVQDMYGEVLPEVKPKNNQTIKPNQGTTMTTTTTTTTTTVNKGFDVKAFLKTAAVLANTEAAPAAKVYPCPEWLTLKSGVISQANSFTVTAGVIKAARQVMDAISYTQRQYEAATEALLIQELRATRVTSERNNFGPEITKLGVVLSSRGGASDAPGFNPDGYEFSTAYDEAAAEVEKLEAVLANGERIITEIVAWIGDNAEDLGLKVETGYTVKLGPIGNEIRTPRMELLTADTLLYGINAQREFIRANR